MSSQETVTGPSFVDDEAPGVSDATHEARAQAPPSASSQQAVPTAKATARAVLRPQCSMSCKATVTGPGLVSDEIPGMSDATREAYGRDSDREAHRFGGGLMAIHLAAHSGHGDAISALIEARALCACGGAGPSPADLARANGHGGGVVEYLARAEAAEAAQQRVRRGDSGGLCRCFFGQ